MTTELLTQVLYQSRPTLKKTLNVTKGNMNKHMRNTTHDIKSSREKTIGKTSTNFTFKTNLHRHTKGKIHMNTDEDYRCEECALTFKNIQLHNQHMMKAHKIGGRSYQYLLLKSVEV